MIKLKFNNSSTKHLPINLFLCSVFVILLGNSYSFAENTDSLFYQTYDTIYIASEPDYPPYCLVDENGYAEGFAVELFEASAEAAGLNTKIKIGLWNVIKQELAEGKIDALPLVGKTPEREKIFDFTIPYLSLHGAIFKREGEYSLNSLDDLKEKPILVMRGDNAEEFLLRNNISSKIITTNTFEEAFIKLANGQGDAILTQRVIGLNLIKDLKLKNIVASKLQVPEFRQDFCFAVQKGDDQLLSRINEGLSIVIANNTYNEIHTKWFGPALNPKFSTQDIIRIAVIIIIPILIIVALFFIFFLRKLVQNKTKQLLQEIKERKDIERSLKQNEYYLNKAQEIGQIGTWELNIKEDILIWTEECYKIFGVPIGTSITMDSLFEIIHPDDRTYVAEKWDEAFHHAPYDIEHRILVNNKVKWVREKADIEFNYKGEAIMAIGFAQDITNRKITEAKIINNEKSLRELLNNLNAGVVVHSADTSIIRTNPRACELFGLSEDQMKGKIAIDPAWKFIRDDGSDMSIEEFPVNIVLNTQKQLSNYITGVYIPQKNKIEWLLLSGIPVLNSKNEIFEVIINFVDITERRKAEKALIENTTFMHKIIESSAISTWISDDKGTAIRTNQACLDLFGAKQNEVLGKYNILKDVVVEKNGYMPHIHKVFDEGIVANILIDYNFGEVDHVSVKNATHKIVNSIFTPVTNSFGEVTNVIVQSIDLTEIKQIEAKAIQERNKAQQYLDIAGVMLLSIDVDGIVTMINPEGCEILGYTKDEIIGKYWHKSFLPKDEKTKVYEVEQKLLKGNIDDAHYLENKIKTKSGEERLIAWKNAILTNEQGEITGTLSSGEDITNRKINELELIKAIGKAEEGDRLKTAFLQNMSHEIRTPMNSIMGFASLLPDEDDKKLINSYSDIIIKNSEQLVHIIDDIVLYSRLQNKQMPLHSKEINFIKLLNEIKISFDIPIYQKSVRLLIDVPDLETININSDYEKIWQIYTNLISNAFKYTPSGTISFGMKQENKKWICFVSDTGLGIPNNEIDTIFDRFYRGSNVKGSVSGTGLGLSIVHELVQLLGGKIWVESEIEKGSTFNFFIP